MKLNRHGYVLVEIIMASVIAFGIAYYMLDLTIKLKNKNDDLLVKTLIQTDKAIIQNKLYWYIYSDGDLLDFDSSAEQCNYIKNTIKINNKVITYSNHDYLVDVVNDYTTVGPVDCTADNMAIHISIPLKIEALNENFDVKLDYVVRNNGVR